MAGLNITDAELQELLKLRRKDLNITAPADVNAAVDTFNHAIEESLLKVADQLNKDQDRMMQAVVNQAAQQPMVGMAGQPMVPMAGAPINWRTGVPVVPAAPDVVKMHVMETNVPLFLACLGMFVGFIYIICMLKAMAGKFDLDVEAIRNNQPQNKLVIDIPGKPQLNPNFNMSNLAPPQASMGRGGSGSEVLTDDSMLGDL